MVIMLFLLSNYDIISNVPPKIKT